jgi:hypothetical protein
MTMDDLIIPLTVDRTNDIRQRMAWVKKTISKKRSEMFNKISHSEDWHQVVAAAAGALRPSDGNFPRGFLRNHTDVNLRKKGKISQSDVDTRLATLIQAHPARDIAIASAAHAIATKSLRGILQVDKNVAQGSYWGLDIWLQSLIAANNGNPACLTDLEVQWAHMLLPYAKHGTNAAGLYIKGVSGALRKSNIPNMYIVPEFDILLRRAIPDYVAQLNRFRLQCQWLAAHEAVFWMVELDTSSPSRSPETLHIEHILDTQFQALRLWAKWRPDVDRITHLADMDSTPLCTVLDIAALEGPDVMTGTERTLRQGWIARYNGIKGGTMNAAMGGTQYRGLTVEVSDRTKSTLASTLESLV